ncbi:MAG: ATP-binding protein [Acidobacteria bacterium]|nr:ATP-binding protein [Acidobacteriota bacterium]
MRLSQPFGPRRLLWGALLLGAFILLDLGLFGWLIFRSLSQKEIARVLLETRQEAEGMAELLADRAAQGGQDLYTAIAVERETQTYIDSVLTQRDVVQEVEIFDRDGTLVFKGRAEGSFPLVPGSLSSGGVREVPEHVERTTTQVEATYEVEVPIGDVGMLRIGISRGEIENRVGVLRRELVTQAALVGTVTLILLVGVTSLLWWLWRRSRRLEEQAAEAESLAVIGTLASGLAHEIRNPLNALNLNMQLLDEELPPSSAQRRMLGITQDEIRRLERLVSDFLLYARPRSLERSATSAAELFAACGELLAPELKRRGARLEVVDRTGGELLDIDPEQLQQLLINLVQNALLASREDDEHPVIEVRAEHQDRQVVLQVKDHGVGIARHEREHIFEAFYSTRRGGTGLGLAVVQRIARAHGGEVDVDSAPGAGTAVRVRLPRRSAAPATDRLAATRR